MAKAPQPSPYVGVSGLLDDLQIDQPAPVSKWERFRAQVHDAGMRGQGLASDRVPQQDAQQQLYAQRSQALSMAKELFPDNKQLWVLAAAKPDAFFSTIQEYQKPQKLAQGEQLTTMNGGQSTYNPKTGFAGDNPYVQAQDGTVQYGQARPMTHTETETGANNQRIDDRAAASLAMTQRGQDLSHQVGMANVGVAQGNLGLSRQRLNGTGGAGLEGMTTEQLIALAKGLK